MVHQGREVQAPSPLSFVHRHNVSVAAPTPGRLGVLLNGQVANCISDHAVFCMLSTFYLAGCIAELAGFALAPESVASGLSDEYFYSCYIIVMLVLNAPHIAHASSRTVCRASPPTNESRCRAVLGPPADYDFRQAQLNANEPGEHHSQCSAHGARGNRVILPSWASAGLNQERHPSGWLSRDTLRS